MTEVVGVNQRVLDGLRGTARLVTAPVWRRLRPRIEAIARDQAAPALVAANRRADRTDRAIDEVRGELVGRIAELEGRLGEVGAALAWLDGEHRRIAPQLAALESRVAELEHAAAAVEPDAVVEPVSAAAVLEPDTASVAALVEEIRVEHARVRARLGLVSRYEERITRLERAQDS
ncbi:hypothetical protein [Actinokineospora sp. NBRC 105648]|uniref:hypothetical protein n=1 Tax=Actinokineospora sp. NBRC 105648 TaxID=3032206 RepID=UPI0024A0EEC3|nr:hypothetical protein [Actinokineospora sp. NBRC 105648]GLZ40666.1 hypothetical protein Acsp05_42900 [Actinokineospora sp. NBRC 105648]